MCKVFQISKSSYYHWLIKKPCERELYRQEAIKKIKNIYTISKGRYGSPRIAKELQMSGFKISRKLVAKLMRKENMQSIIKRKFKSTTDSSHHYPVVENVLRQEFTV
ncbi:IS3 family transposase [Chryseobacterium sp. KC 927]|uniref:IS3 family transposase n=2 Tax=Chryseobacterium luquanense TaxID=2983766 RepID=A0ABT3Y811_9FLAO|nr:IS3 family transposase [Chryseobacterium luquanense]